MKKIYLNIKYGKDKSTKGYILNISRGGMGITCRKRLSKNTAIQIKVEKNILLPMKAKVVSSSYRHKKDYGYMAGVKFIFTEVEKKEKLDKFIRKMEKRRAIRFSLI